MLFHLECPDIHSLPKKFSPYSITHIRRYFNTQIKGISHKNHDRTVGFFFFVRLSAGLVFLCLAFPVFSILQAIGKAGIPVKIMLVGTVVKLAGNLLLIPSLYTAGAALSTSLSYAVILVLALLALHRELGEKLHLGKPLLCIVYAALMCGAAAWLAYSRLLPYLPQRPALLAAIAAGGAVYLLVLFLGMGRELKEMLKS